MIMIARSGGAAIAAVDLFCGAGGLTRGLLDAGIPVAGGFDIDPACCFPYEFNNGHSKFHQKSVVDLSGAELAACYPPHHIRVLVGCAPCQPFSKYTQGTPTQDNDKWRLLHEFGRLVQHVKPDVISMENVPELQRHGVFFEFVANLEQAGYHVSFQEAFCPDFGIAQQRKRLVLLASLLGEIRLIQPPKTTFKFTTVRDAIAHLPKLSAGEVHAADMMHRACKLSQLNFKRVQASRPGGSWREWPAELVAKCHQAKSGATYPSVYGRMEWDKPAPTITTQFFGFGNGRFGHPEQDRAISLREGAILQSFPADYAFAPEKQPISFATLGRLIGNAVPVKLGAAIGYSIRQHIQSCFDEGGHE
jgi:DNA (cytosine-5)-methyltransferase 1